MKRLLFTVTNDLNFDQRMVRICRSLATAGYEVMLIGRRLPHSPPLLPQPYRQKRLYCFLARGKGFYIEYNIRLFFYLLFQRADGLCAIDLDTILPCYWVSVIKRTRRVYDAHELFCEMKEVVSRPRIYRMWKRIEKFAVPRFSRAYTVNRAIADILQHEYGTEFAVVRNLPLKEEPAKPISGEEYILYQGAVNEGRCFESLIPAMAEVPVPLWICGDGNFLNQARQLVKDAGLDGKVIFKGKFAPAQLRKITAGARIGLTLFENRGLSNYYSLGNRFFDYIHAGLPQVCVDYPAYRELNNQYEVAVLIPDTEPDSISAAINRLLSDTGLHQRLHENCLKAREEWNWQLEEEKLLVFYHSLWS